MDSHVTRNDRRIDIYMTPEKLNTHMTIRLDQLDHRHTTVSAGASQKYSDVAKFERSILCAEVSPKGIVHKRCRPSFGALNGI